MDFTDCWRHSQPNAFRARDGCLNQSGMASAVLPSAAGGSLISFRETGFLLNEKYPEITSAFLRQNADSFIANGKIVTFKDGITSFATLQERMQVAHPSANLLRRIPVWLYLFDLLYLDRYDTRQVPLRYRKKLLRNTFKFAGALRFTHHRETRVKITVER